MSFLAAWFFQERIFFAEKLLVQHGAVDIVMNR